jgi:hypothetical protein
VLRPFNCGTDAEPWPVQCSNSIFTLAQLWALGYRPFTVRYFVCFHKHSWFTVSPYIAAQLPLSSRLGSRGQTRLIIYSRLGFRFCPYLSFVRENSHLFQNKMKWVCLVENECIYTVLFDKIKDVSCYKIIRRSFISKPRNVNENRQNLCQVCSYIRKQGRSCHALITWQCVYNSWSSIIKVFLFSQKVHLEIQC